MAERYPRPIIIHSQEKHQVLRRLPLEKPPFPEAELQELLRLHPEILPLADDRYEPPLCIGREIGLGMGCVVDNLYLSPQGYLTVVETKLWKNQEARREVVAQIIEYAKQLSRWTYADLDRAFQGYLEKYQQEKAGLFAWVSGQSEEPMEETEFIDAVTRCLREGEFKLLIVGEGIRENAEEMVEFLHELPHLRFNLALIELACYALADNDGPPFLIVPRVLARTKELNRTVVTITMSEELRGKIGLDVKTPVESTRPGQSPQPLEESDFYLKLAVKIGKPNASKIEDYVRLLSEELGLERVVTTYSMLLKFNAPDDAQCTLMSIDLNGNLVRAGELPEWLAKHGQSGEPAEDFVRELNSIHSGFHLRKTPRGVYGYPAVKIQEIVDKLPAIEAAIRRFISRVNQ